MKIYDIDLRDAFLGELYELAKKDRHTMFLTADMGAFGLEKFKRKLRRQYINVGVAEQNMVSIAAGLTLAGKKVFIYAITPFVTLRCFEQISMDICGMNLPVIIVGMGSGFTYSNDGPTHHCLQDTAIMRTLPGISIYNSSDAIMARALARIGYQEKNPVYIRLDKGKYPRLYDNNCNFSEGIAYLKEGKDATIITSGVFVHKAFEVVNMLKMEYRLDVGVIDFYRIKPVNDSFLLSVFVKYKMPIVTIEENMITGGIGSLVSEFMADKEKKLPLKRIAIPDRYCFRYGAREGIYNFYGLNPERIARTIVEWLN